jgi:hypothetical protein
MKYFVGTTDRASGIVWSKFQGEFGLTYAQIALHSERSYLWTYAGKWFCLSQQEQEERHVTLTHKKKSKGRPSV